MADNLIRCNHYKMDCFGYYCGQCRILTEQITDKPCPFYKSRMHDILLDSRVTDVIQTWEQKMSERKG